MAIKTRVIRNKNKFLSGEYIDPLITIMFSENDTVFLYGNDIIQNTFYEDRYTASGEKVEIGCAISSEIGFKIRNIDDTYEGKVFEGKRCRVYMRITDTTSTQIGDYFITEVSYGKNYISIVALDYMISLEKSIDWTSLMDAYATNKTGSTYNSNVECMIAAIANINGFNDAYLSGDVTANADFDDYSMVQNTDITYRNLLQYISLISGCFAYCDESRCLIVTWYEDTLREYVDDAYTVVKFESNEDNRYASKIAENSITITGISYTDENGNVYTSGSEGYVLSYTGCKLITSTNAQAILDNIMTKIGGFTYYPMEAVMKRFPYLMPGELINFVNPNTGDVVETIVTNRTFKLNGAMTIAAKGESSKTSEYVDVNKLTAATQQAISESEAKTKEALRQTVKDAMKWTLLADVATTHTIEGIEDYSEFLIVCRPTSAGRHGRALASTVVPASNFLEYTTDHGDGAHQAYYSSSYFTGASYLGNNQVKLYAHGQSYCNLYAR